MDFGKGANCFWTLYEFAAEAGLGVRFGGGAPICCCQTQIQRDFFFFDFSAFARQLNKTLVIHYSTHVHADELQLLLLLLMLFFMWYIRILQDRSFTRTRTPAHNVTHKSKRKKKTKKMIQTKRQQQNKFVESNGL